MRLSDKTRWLLGFTAVFAALVGFVFWGTWALDVTPIMPDAETTYPMDAAWRNMRDMLASGKFIPSDLMRLVGSPYFWQELRYAIALYAAALGMVYFCRGRGLSRPASYGAGLLLAFCGYWATLFSAGHYGWFCWMTYGVFAFGLADRAVRKGRLRHALLFGLVLAWASFNQQDLWLLFTAFTSAYAIWCCVRERKFPGRSACAALAVFVLVGAPNFKDTIQNTLRGRVDQIERGENVTDKAADKADQRWEFVTNWSMPPEDTLEFFDARAHGDTSCPFVLSINRREGVEPYTGALGRPLKAARGNYRQHSLYVGWVTCLLALAGFLSFVWSVRGEKRSGEVLFFILAALVFYALSLGRYFAPAYRVIFALPFGDLIRCPVKWHHLTEFCLVVLAAHGVGYLVRRLAVFGRYAAWGVWALVLVGAADLAFQAHRFCAPVSVQRARAQHRKAEFTILDRRQFANPQIAALAKGGQIVSVASYLGSPNHFVVQVLQPFEPYKGRGFTWTAALLGLVSLLTASGVVAFCLISSRRPIDRADTPRARTPDCQPPQASRA